MLFRAVLLTVLALSVTSTSPTAQQQDPPAAAADSAGMPTVSEPLDPASLGVVVIAGDTLFTIQTRLGPYTPVERASGVQRRLELLIGNPLYRFDGVEFETGELSIDLVVADQVLTSVTQADAEAAGLSREELAELRSVAIEGALVERTGATRLRTIAIGIGLSVFAAAAAFFLLRLITGLFGRIIRLVEGGRDTWIPAVRVQKLEIISAASLAGAVVSLARLVRVVLIILLFYTSIPVILSFFPWTEHYADQLFGYVLTPFVMVWTAFIGYFPDLLAIGAITVVTWYLLKLIRPIFMGLRRESITISGFYPEWAMPTYQIVRVLVMLFAFVAIWPYLPGSGSPAFQGVGVFVGLLLSLGSASAIGNMVGGVVLTYMRPFKVGDRVRIADTEGDVTEKTLLVTRIRTPKNVEITVPNAMVLGSHIVNYSAKVRDRHLVLHTTVTIGYDVPWRTVHRLLIESATATSNVLAEPAPFVHQTSLGDFYVSYEINGYTNRPSEMAATYSQLRANIQDRFQAAGIEIMSPHYRAQRDGGATTVPAVETDTDESTQFVPEVLR